MLSCFSPALHLLLLARNGGSGESTRPPTKPCANLTLSGFSQETQGHLLEARDRDTANPSLWEPLVPATTLVHANEHHPVPHRNHTPREPSRSEAALQERSHTLPSKTLELLPFLNLIRFLRQMQDINTFHHL